MLKKCDKLLLSWLLASISESLFAYIAKFVTANDVWKALETYFVTKSRLRVVHLKNALQTFKKGMLDVSNYIKKMKEIVNALNVSDQSISKRDLIVFIVDGIDVEYDPVTVHIYSKLHSSSNNITLIEVKFILQKFEQKLNRNSLLTLDLYGGFANLASQVHSNNQTLEEE